MAGVAGVFLAERLILSSSMLMSFSDNCKMEELAQGLGQVPGWEQGAGSRAYVPDELVDLLSAHVVHGHHRVQGSVADRCVPVPYVDGDLLQRLGRCGLTNVHPVTLNETAQLLQTL